MSEEYGSAKLPSSRSRRLAVARLIIAWIVTVAVLPLAWARTYVLATWTGQWETLSLVLTAVGLIAVAALTFGLGQAFASKRFRMLVGVGIAVSWFAALAVLVPQFNGTRLPSLAAVCLLLPVTLWVPWSAWMFFAPFHWLTRASVLAVLFAALAGGRYVLRIDGLTGDARVNFAPGWATPSQELGTASQTDQPPAFPVDLTKTTPHDYPQFLGPERLGVVRHATLARDWKSRPPRLLWRQPVGSGWGSFAVVGDFAITQEQRGELECVVCYRISDGATAWIHSEPARFDSPYGGPGPRATPTVADGRVYAVGATGILNCLDGSNGRVIWTVDILKDNGTQNIVHGVCASPLLIDDRVIVSPAGAANVSLAAYERSSGKRAWQGGEEPASYSSPLLTELGGQRQILFFTSQNVTGHDAASGKVLWKYPLSNSEHTNCSQPIPNAGAAGQVFAGTGYGTGGVLLRVEQGSDGSWKAQPIWQNNRMKTKFTTAVLHDGYLYGLDDGILQCLDIKTGDMKWKSGRYQHGQVLLAGDLLIVQAENGTVVLVEANPEKLHELGRIEALTGKTWNNPALAGKHLLVRNDHEAACYELALEKD